ncbi:unnamed protein product [Prunus armeniaca]
MEFCKVEITELLQKGIICRSKSPWSCPAFYVQKNAELERGVPRLSQIGPIDRVIQFADKFPDQIFDKSQLQRLQSNPPPSSSAHTEIVKQIKIHVKALPCLGIPSVDSFKIVETDASDIGYGGKTMAPKKDKQKESASQPSQPKSIQPFRILPPSMSKDKQESSSQLPSQIVPFPCCSPIQVSNRFSSLGTTVGQIRPNY